jgi:tetratricopeptide (TPR) repeat protein
MTTFSIQFSAAEKMKKEGKFKEALILFKELDKKTPEDFRVLNQIGLLEAHLKNYETALSILLHSIKLRPDQSYIVVKILHIFVSLSQPQKAINFCQDIMSKGYKRAEFYFEIARLYKRLNDPVNVHNSLKKATETNPNFYQAWNDLANLYRGMAKFKDALGAYNKAIKAKPNYAEGFNNRGHLLQDFKMHKEALADYNEALKIIPNYSIAYINKALVLLMMGEYIEGWNLYEWRRGAYKKNDRGIHKPLWLGDISLAGKTILIYGEQGIGDVIQFSRYIENFKSMSTRVIFEVPKSLIPLCVDLLPHDYQVISYGEVLPEFDFYCPIMSLPCAFKTDINNIPNKVPYFFASQDKQAEWKKILGQKKNFRVGLAWSGLKGRYIDKNPCRNRSIPILFLKELMTLPLDFHSLHIEFKSEDEKETAKNFGIQLHDHRIKSFADTAALMCEMDLILTIDTSVAHLAGALGLNFWVMLPFSTDYRWTENLEKSPWYPTSKLYRADKPGNWAFVIDLVKKDLIDVTSKNS